MSEPTRWPEDREPVSSAERLESWKEIAAYLRRGVRTVRRWEQEEGLPVRRQAHKKLGTVYAYRPELDAWREGRRVESAPAAAAPARSRTPAARRLIAVLPFENLSGDSGQDYVADGLTEEMISQLGRSHPETLGVIARTTMFQYRAIGRTVRQIGDELRVDYIIEGSMRREGNRLRVTAQLIRVRDQTYLWSGAYEEAIRSVLSLQRELASDIGREIRLKLSTDHLPPSAETKTVDPEAYHTHLKGRHFLNRFTPASIRRSVDYFRRAIDKDPTYAASHASLAEAYERLPLWIDGPPAETLPLALEAAEHALELDPTLPEGHASLGVITANYSWDWSKAERHFQRALELNPSCLPARHWYAEFLAEMGRIDEALVTIERARRLDPLSSSIQTTRAFVLLMARQFDEAIAELELVLEMEPEYPMALLRLGVAYDGAGKYDEAVRALRRTIRAAPDLLAGKSLLGYVLARAGDERAALDQLDKLQRLAGRRYVPAFLFANVYAGLGDQDAAVACIEREYQARGWYLLLLKRAHQFDVLRSHPRFEALMRRMKFPV